MKKIVIIGAGIAGLSAGIFARKKGFEVDIYESHFLPGGMCTSWKRKGYTFEGCLHFIGLAGSSRRHMYYKTWKELGVFPETQIKDHEVIHQFQDSTGRVLKLYSDVRKLRTEMIRLSPADEKEIRTMCRTIGLYCSMVRNPGFNPLRMLSNLLGIILAIPRLIKYGKITIKEYVKKFQDPLIRKALENFFIYSDFPSTSLFLFFAAFHIKGSGFPLGSSLNLVRKIEKKFLDLQGRIHYRKTVKRILTENNQARGIELDDGTIIMADIVISAADQHSVLTGLLGDRFTPQILQERYKNQPLFHPLIQVSLGINRDMSGIDHSVNFQTAEKFEIAGKSRDSIWIQHFAFDSSMAPSGKTSLVVLYPSTLEWWEKLGYGSEAYKSEKARIAEITIDQLEKLFPGIKSQVEVKDVATPCTTFRYTHNWKSAISFIMTKDIADELFFKPLYSLPGLKHFYMAGQWVKGLGTIMAAVSGKEVIRKVCKDEGSGANTLVKKNAEAF